MMYSPYLLLLGFSFSLAMASAQPITKNQFQQYQHVIANTEGQHWILEAWGTRLGTEQKCTQGKSWIFFADGMLIKRMCYQGKVIDTNHSWSINNATSEPAELIIDTTPHWIEILIDKIEEPGLPPSEEFIAKIQEIRANQEQKVNIYRLRRTKSEPL